MGLSSTGSPCRGKWYRNIVSKTFSTAVSISSILALLGKRSAFVCKFLPSRKSISDLPHHSWRRPDEIAVEWEGQIAESDHHADCVADQIDVEVVRLRDAELARRNDLLPAPAVVREEDEHREAIVDHPPAALEEIELEPVDVAHLDNLHGLIDGVEEVE